MATQTVTLDAGAALLIDQYATLVQGVTGFDSSNVLEFDNSMPTRLRTVRA